jgi:hypothetical protein
MSRRHPLPVAAVPARVPRAAAVLAAGASLLVATLLAACAASQPTGTNTPLNLPYAVVFGHVSTTNNSTSVLVNGEAYLDSADALSRSQPFGGFNAISVDTGGNYATAIFSQVPRKVYFDIIAVSARPSGADTVRAIPVQLDSLGGTPPHDSVEVDFHLP